MKTPTTDSGTPPAGKNQLHRVLKARHLTMIALGGAIGTGLFIASGAAIAQAGPGGALTVYLQMCIRDRSGTRRCSTWRCSWCCCMASP